MLYYIAYPCQFAKLGSRQQPFQNFCFANFIRQIKQRKLNTSNETLKKTFIAAAHECCVVDTSSPFYIFANIGCFGLIYGDASAVNKKSSTSLLKRSAYLI